MVSPVRAYHEFISPQNTNLAGCMRITCEVETKQSMEVHSPPLHNPQYYIVLMLLWSGYLTRGHHTYIIIMFMNVHEAGRPGEPRPTPQELNATFRNLCERLPSKPLNLERLSATQKGREQLEHVRSLGTEFDRLLDHAVNGLETITPSFGHVLAGRFKLSWFTNSFKENLLLLTNEDLESGGIFEPDGAKDLECKAYREDTNNLLLLKSGSSLILRRHGYTDIEERLSSVMESPENMHEQWREQFYNLHQEYP